jgi:hypothetical protein
VTSVPSIETPRGHTRVSSRAVSRVVSALAAEALGVAARQVTVDLAENGGALDITVRVPVRVLPGQEDRTDAHGSDAQGSEPQGSEAQGSAAQGSEAQGSEAQGSDDDKLQARATQAEEHIRSTTGELTGARVNDVSVGLTKSRIRLPGLGD